MKNTLDKILTELELNTYVYKVDENSFIPITITGSSTSILRELSRITEILDEHEFYYRIDENYNIVLA